MKAYLVKKDADARAAREAQLVQTANTIKLPNSILLNEGVGVEHYTHEQIIAFSFSVLDANGDHVITRPEINRYITKVGA